jgi:hypothetical protein
MRGSEKKFLNPSYVHERIFVVDPGSALSIENFFYCFRKIYIKMKLLQVVRTPKIFY